MAASSDPQLISSRQISIPIHDDPADEWLASLNPSDEWLASITNETSSDDSSVINSPSQKPKIQKVPEKLGQIESNKKCYEPSVVSIGPYHHGKPELQSVEKLKTRMARDFAKDCHKPIVDLYDKIAAVSGLARSCYAAEDGDGSIDQRFDRTAFTRMMFLDGCFILHFIDCVLNKRATLKMKRDTLAYVQRDLLLLENQLPFQVLAALMSLRFHEKNEGMDLLKAFIKQTRALPPPQKGSKTEVVPEMPAEDEEQPVHLLDLLRTQLIDKTAIGPTCAKTQSQSTDWCSYRSVNELKGTGIHFQASETNRFTDVKFESGFISGNLRLPPMTVDDSTKSMLLNLVAYETCPDGSDDSAVTSYICFMDSLIDHAEDVRVLRSKGILLNFLGSDQQVADLFNEIGNGLVPNPHVYVGVKVQIERHYRNNCKIWIAEWVHTHFRSPWAFLAFLAALFALALTVAQTYYAVHPTK